MGDDPQRSIWRARCSWIEESEEIARNRITQGMGYGTTCDGSVNGRYGPYLSGTAKLNGKIPKDRRTSVADAGGSAAIPRRDRQAERGRASARRSAVAEEGGGEGPRRRRRPPKEGREESAGEKAADRRKTAARKAPAKKAYVSLHPEPAAAAPLRDGRAGRQARVVKKKRRAAVLTAPSRRGPWVAASSEGARKTAMNTLDKVPLHRPRPHHRRQPRRRPFH